LIDAAEKFAANHAQSPGAIVLYQQSHQLFNTTIELCGSGKEYVSDRQIHGFPLSRSWQVFPSAAIDMQLCKQVEVAALDYPAVVSRQSVHASETVANQRHGAISDLLRYPADGSTPLVKVFSAGA